MIAHVVLLRPRADLTAAERETLLTTFKHAMASIPSIARAQIGRRTILGHRYDATVTEPYEYFVLVEFDTQADLEAYLAHPAHVELGRLFYVTSEAATAFDFVVVDPGRVEELL